MEKIYDLIIIGGGPAGLSSGIYAGRAKLDVLVLEKEDDKAGQISLTSEVVNYPGIIEISGKAYMDTLKKQAKNFNVKFTQANVTGFDFNDEIKIVKTNNQEYKALSVLIATGSAPRKLGFNGEEKFTGRGVAYCATCDGEFFTGMEVFVIGAGFAAAEEAMFLTKYAKHVTIIAREPEFTCASSIADKVKAHPKITVKFNTEITELLGEDKPKIAKFKNNVTNELSEYVAKDNETFGVFVFVGYAPSSDLFKDSINLDKYGFILTNEDLETNIKGVYAAGDIRPKRLRQIVTAVSDGAIAATSIEKYVYELREKLGLIKEEVIEEKEEIKEESFLDETLKGQLAQIVERFENPVKLVVFKDETNEESLKIEAAVKEISEISDKIDFVSYNKGENEQLEKEVNLNYAPTIVILDKDGKYRNLKYSSLPGGHELNSFILGMYNVAGPGQKISNENSVARIKEIDKKINIKVGISLSCTKCPKTVQSAQRIATLNDNIEMEMINIFTFTEFKDKYNIMSVPAVVINDKDVYFGEKDVQAILDILK